MLPMNSIVIFRRINISNSYISYFGRKVRVCTLLFGDCTIFRCKKMNQAFAGQIGKLMKLNQVHCLICLLRISAGFGILFMTIDKLNQAPGQKLTISITRVFKVKDNILFSLKRFDHQLHTQLLQQDESNRTTPIDVPTN